MAVKKMTKKLKPEVIYTEKDLISFGESYSEISAKIKELEAKKKALSTQIKDLTEKFGVKDDKGSFYYDSDDFIMGKVCKKSFSLEQETAIKTLHELGLEDCITTVEVVNEDELSKAISNGRITMQSVDSFTKEKVNYSVSVVKKEKVTAEVQQTTLKSVARKK